VRTRRTPHGTIHPACPLGMQCSAIATQTDTQVIRQLVLSRVQPCLIPYAKDTRRTPTVSDITPPGESSNFYERPSAAAAKSQSLQVSPFDPTLPAITVKRRGHVTIDHNPRDRGSQLASGDMDPPVCVLW
jgi:hypothetical protein